MQIFQHGTYLGQRYLRICTLGLASLLPSGCGQVPQVVDTPVETEPAPPEEESVQISGPAFWDAAAEGQLDTVRQAIEAGVDVNITDRDGRTALLLAAFDGHTEVVRLLLDHGAQIDHRDAAGRTPLMYASTGANDESVRLLLKAGAQPNLTDRGEGFTALMHAAAEGQLKVVQTLLDHKADPTIRDVDGDTARDFAVQNGHTEVAVLLQ